MGASCRGSDVRNTTARLLMLKTKMTQVGVTSLLLILGIFCSAEWARGEGGCHDGQFACGAQAMRQCIPTCWVCDGDNDCGDSSDEAAEICANRECREGYVKCEGDSPSRWCVQSFWICDGDDDCGNNWDEDPTMCALRTCGPDRFQCANGGRCIPSPWVCDGDNDCGDLSDEQNCTCNADQFQCANNGRCIPARWICDGDNDCGDLSDEQDCAVSTQRRGNKKMKKVKPVRKIFPSLF